MKRIRPPGAHPRVASNPLTPPRLGLNLLRGLPPEIHFMPARLPLLLLLVALPVRADAPPNVAALDQITPALRKFVDDRDIAGAVAVVGRSDGFTHTATVGFRDLDRRAPMEK